MKSEKIYLRMNNPAKWLTDKAIKAYSVICCEIEVERGELARELGVTIRTLDFVLAELRKSKYIVTVQAGKTFSYTEREK